MLCNPPFNRPIAEVAGMTARQMSDLFGCERDEHGNVVPEEEDEGEEREPLHPKTAFFDLWRRDGLRDDQIEILWREMLAGNPALRRYLGL